MEGKLNISQLVKDYANSYETAMNSEDPTIQTQHFNGCGMILSLIEDNIRQTRTGLSEEHFQHNLKQN